MSRDQAADAVGLERSTVAHHLDRLADDGLLDVEYRRLSGRQGPGAGRPSKLYRRARRDFGVSLPPRDYELAGRMLARAADRSMHEGMPISEAIEQIAAAEGRAIAEEVNGCLAEAGSVRQAMLEVLARHGFEPREEDDNSVVLSNCPFHQLSEQHTELICGMNLGLLEAAVEGVGTSGLKASLEPEPGFCCVRFRANP